ncbi:MAG: DUF3530 family protein [Gammaproteobacteria bacterium]
MDRTQTIKANRATTIDLKKLQILALIFALTAIFKPDVAYSLDETEPDQEQTTSTQPAGSSAPNGNVPLGPSRNTELEIQWQVEILKTVDPGEVEWLEQDGIKTFALYLQNRKDKLQGGAILLHPLGTHPNWPYVIAPLRRKLPEYGWSTLSIQLPTLAKSASVEEYLPLLKEFSTRIQSAIKFYQHQGIANITLIGDALGATVAASFLAANPDSGITSFVAISMLTYKDKDQQFNAIHSLEQIALPVLDTFGSRDLSNVRKYADDRGISAKRAGQVATQSQNIEAFSQSATAKTGVEQKAGYIAYRRFEITGADHSFKGFENILSKRVIGWLKKHAGGIAINTTR